MTRLKFRGGAGAGAGAGAVADDNHHKDISALHENLAATTKNQNATATATPSQRQQQHQKQQQQAAAKHFYDSHCAFVPAMAGWFLFSVLLSSYNKIVFGKQHSAFPCPLLLTSIHFGVQWMFSEIACYAFPDALGRERVASMSWREFLSLSIPCGLVTLGDIGLSNLSMVTMSITFYTMVKATTPLFVLGWAYWFGLERITWTLLAVICVIAFGEFLTVLGEVDFELRGLLLCLGGSFLSGARWALVQLKIQTLTPPLKTTITIMKVLSPSMFVCMLFLSFVIENPYDKLQNHSIQALGNVLALGVVGALLATAMILCQYYLIMHASAVILQVGGVVKEVITICVGVVFFHDTMNRINTAGCFVVFLGVVLYKVTHHMAKQKEKELQNEDNTTGLLQDDDDVDYIDEEEGGHQDDEDDEYDRDVDDDDDGEMYEIMVDGIPVSSTSKAQHHHHNGTSASSTSSTVSISSTSEEADTNS